VLTASKIKGRAVADPAWKAASEDRLTLPKSVANPTKPMRPKPRKSRVLGNGMVE